MSNWDGLLATARDEGRLPAMFPADLAIPMVAPGDLGRAAAARLLSPLDDVGVKYVEGPQLYSPNDVAGAFSRALDRQVDVEVTPREALKDAFLGLGFSDAAADSYARMTAVSIDCGFDVSDGALRGATSIDAYIGDLVAASAGH